MALGAVEVKVMVCAPLATVTVCCTCGAARKVLFPAWLALMVQLPMAWKLTWAPVRVQTALLAGSMAKLTRSPELADAGGVEAGPPTVALGAVVVKVKGCAACGVTALEAVEGVPVPAELTAATVNV